MTGAAIVEDSLSDSQQASASVVNYNLDTGTTGVTTSIYEFSEVDIDDWKKQRWGTITKVGIKKRSDHHKYLNRGVSIG